MKTVKFEDVSESDRYREARNRLANRTAAIELRVVERLRAVQEQHDLDWRLLLASQRKISRRTASGKGVSPSEFWETEAAPRAAALTTAATLVIDSDLQDLEPAVTRFKNSITSAAGSNYLLEAAKADVLSVLQPLLDVVDDSGIDALGERWQRRLRRQATQRLLGNWTTTSRQQFRQMVAREELLMLDQAPWIHGDRYLTAFELAHCDIRALMRDRVETAANIVIDDADTRGVL